MKIEKNVDLSQYCTIGLGGLAKYFAKVTDKNELIEVVEFAQNESLDIHVLGDGSNTVFTDTGFEGVVIKLENKGIEISDSGLVNAAAGENWDKLVEKSVSLGFSGIEALSLIPGTVGAAPVQNIGAYGQEISDCFVSLIAWDVENKKYVDLNPQDCSFGYRTSMLKQNPGKFIVMEVSLQLKKDFMQPPFYTTLQKYFDEHSISEFSPKNVRNAVVAWRTSYLPDVEVVRTAGSFFTNPIISKAQLDKIIETKPEINNWETKWYWETKDGQYKVAAGRLAENIGLKNYKDEKTGMATWKNSALILVNESAENYSDLAEFRKSYLNKIEQTYGIKFEQEPVEV